MIKIIFMIFGLFFIFLFSYTVSADFVCTEKSFGGKADIEDNIPDFTVYNTLSFGGKIEAQSEAPSIQLNYPGNESIGIEMNPTLNVTVNDFQDDNFNITWSTNSSGDWIIIYYHNNCSDGIFTYNATFANSSNTTYWWKIECNDTNNNWNNKTYSFTIGDYQWNDWSCYWKIGYTSKYDVTRNMLVNVLDISAVAFNYSEEGDPGWIPQDVNEDGEIGIEDLVQVSLHYGENYN